MPGMKQTAQKQTTQFPVWAIIVVTFACIIVGAYVLNALGT